MTDDLRERIAAAILARLMQPAGPTPSEYDLADAVLAVGIRQLRAAFDLAEELRQKDTAKLDASLERATRARALHPSPAELVATNAESDAFCPTCIHPAPCPTRRALDGEDAARENRGSEIHGEPRTGPSPTRDTRPAP